MESRRPETSEAGARGGTRTAAGSAWIFAIALLVYLRLAPTVPGPGDSGEFTLVLATGGVPHPTGYPLYTLLGHPFVVAAHALGASWAFAANAWSALGGALAVALMYGVAAAWIPARAGLSGRARALIALLPVALFALNPVWTSEATLAEVHAWQLAWVLGTALVFIRMARVLAAAEALPNRRLLGLAALWGLLCGIGLAHHATAVLFAAPLSLGLIVALARARRLGLAPIAIALAAALVPLASYASLCFKASHPGPAVWPSLEPTWASVLSHATGAQYRAFLGHYRPIASEKELLGPYVYPFVLPWLPLMVVSAARARSTTERLVGWALCGSVALQLLFVFAYGVPDPTSYFVPAMAIGLCAIAPFGVELSGVGGRVKRLLVTAGAALALVAVLMAWPWTKAAVIRNIGLDLLERRLRETWSSIPFERGVILWGSDMTYRLRIYQVLDGERPDVAVVNPMAFTNTGVRGQFVARHGFDPLEGAALSPEFLSNPVPAGPAFERFISAVGSRMEQGMGLPVAIFDPRHHRAVPLDRFPVRDSASATR